MFHVFVVHRVPVDAPDPPVSLGPDEVTDVTAVISFKPPSASQNDVGEIHEPAVPIVKIPVDAPGLPVSLGPDEVTDVTAVTSFKPPSASQNDVGEIPVNVIAC